jgi:hypothetical protein
MQNQQAKQIADKKKMGPARKQPVSKVAQSCSLFDLAAILMLQREEALLGDIITECNQLMTLANQEADEVADSIEEVL